MMFMRTLANIALLSAVPRPPAALNGSLATGYCKMDLRVKPSAGSARTGPPLNEHEVRGTCVPGRSPEQAADRLPERAAPLRRVTAALAGALALLPRAADRPLGAPTVVQVHQDTPRRPTADDGKLNNTRESSARVLEVRHSRASEGSSRTPADGRTIRPYECVAQVDDGAIIYCPELTGMWPTPDTSYMVMPFISLFLSRRRMPHRR
jgi:hypothetical protein